MVLARKLKVGVYKRCQEGLGSGGNPSTWGILETTVHVEAFQLKNFPICQTELCLLTLPGFSIKLAVLKPRCKKKSFTKTWAFTGHYGHLAKNFECNSKSLIMNCLFVFLLAIYLSIVSKLHLYQILYSLTLIETLLGFGN